ncbi:uncharacterized protein TNCT_692771 [Trichonephila clavata]|uniref:Uncharacterized protein n=1 Tax=Trichonephila clavata TaxID=2740835 RepID=A0A8X6G539_TRICU|nr:uncharacterized protein TNCT_692771 [Trichonephila clavata]
MTSKSHVRPEDRVRSIIRHIDNVNFTASDCEIHPKKPCLLLLNNFNQDRFHCLYANRSTVWKSYTINQSCDIPEHFYEMIEMYTQLGSEYVLPFAGHFRESSGYTIGMFRQSIQLYAPRKIQRLQFKETVYALVVFFCAVCYQMGGAVPDLKQFLFLYTDHHPVLCDIGDFNVENRVRLKGHKPHLNEKKWRRVMQKKTLRDVIRYLKLEFKLFFHQKKKKGKRCILDEPDEAFDTETHELLCQSGHKSLILVLREFCHLMPNNHIRNNIVGKWVACLGNTGEEKDEEMML